MKSYILLEHLLLAAEAQGLLLIVVKQIESLKTPEENQFLIWMQVMEITSNHQDTQVYLDNLDNNLDNNLDKNLDKNLNKNQDTQENR